MATSITTIQLGPLPYAVVEVERLYSADHKPLMGEIDYSQCCISLAAEQAGVMKPITLWHELIHGMLFGAGLTNHDEQVIDAVAHGIVDALRQNPQLRDLEALWPR